MQQTPVKLGSCLKQSRQRKSSDCRDVIVSQELRFQNACSPHRNKKKRKAAVFKFLRFKKSFFEKLRFRDGLVWTAGQTVEIKLRLIFNCLRRYGARCLSFEKIAFMIHYCFTCCVNTVCFL